LAAHDAGAINRNPCAGRAKIQKMRVRTVIDRDLLGALGEGPWALLFFFIARSASPACASDGYSKKVKI